MMNYEAMANDFLAKTETNFYVLNHFGKVDKWGDFMDEWEVEFVRNKKSWSFNFYMGSGHKGEAPTAYDVLASLTKYEVGTIEEFCSEFGYELFDDYGMRNVNTYHTYKAVKAEYKHVLDMFGDVLDELCEIQ